MSDAFFERVFGDSEPGHFGTGWMSGTGGVFLGALALAGVLVFQFPGVLSTGTFRAQYPVGALRALLQIVIGAAFLLSATSLILRRTSRRCGASTPCITRARRWIGWLG